MSKIYSNCKETNSKKELRMFSNPFISRIVNIVCPAAPKQIRIEYPNEILIDDGKLHEVVIHKLLTRRKLIF